MTLLPVLICAALLSPRKWNYIVDVVVNTSNAETFALLRDSLEAIKFPLQLDNDTNVTEINITTGIESVSKQRRP